jgi:hypothetical protein
MTVTILEDIVSLRKKDGKGNPHIYAKKGQKVALVSVRGNVLIVEDHHGVRFPVKIERTDYIDEAEPT